MGNDRSQILLRALLGGVLAGTGLSLSGLWWMLPALALLWSVALHPAGRSTLGGLPWRSAIAGCWPCTHSPG